MSNDPKSTNVDKTKLIKTTPAATVNITQPQNAKPLITSLNEGANLCSEETAEKLLGQENFTKNKESGKK